MRAPFSFLKSGATVAWTPLDDVTITSGLYLPGGYSTSGKAGVDQTATWVDASGNGRPFHGGTTIGGAPTAPRAHADGYPIFNGEADRALAALGLSIGTDFASPGNGAIIVIAQHDNLPEDSSGHYANTAFVMGSSATPGLVIDKLGARMEAYDDFVYQTAVNSTVHPYEAKLIAGKWDSVGIYVAAGGAGWGAVQPYTSPSTAISAANIGADTYIGMGYSLTHQVHGAIKAVAFYPNAADVTDAKLAQWQAWAEAQGLVASWSPRDDAGTQAGLLLMPGDYDDTVVVGGGNGRWKDSSGNGYDADIQAGTITGEFGCPVFDGSGALQASVSPADDVTYPANHVGTPTDGTMIVIAEQYDALSPFVAAGPYASSAPICGTGATPQIGFFSDGAYADGYNNSGPATYDGAVAPSGIARPNVSHLLAGAWDGVGIYAACDENAFSAVTPYQTAGTGLSVGNIGLTHIGRSFSAQFVGKIKCVAIYKTKVTDAKLAQWKAWAVLQGLINPQIIVIAQTAPDMFLPPNTYKPSPSAVWREAGITPHNWVDNLGELAAPVDGPGPTNVGGFPRFASGDGRLGIIGGSWTVNDYAGTGDNEQCIVFNPATIHAGSAVQVYLNESPFDDDGGYIGFYLRNDGTDYWCDYYQWDVSQRLASVNLGPTLPDKVVVQGKKEAGQLFARVNGGSWVAGDPMGSLGSTADGPRSGGSGYGPFDYTGEVLSVVSWTRVLTTGESDAVAAAGAAL